MGTPGPPGPKGSVTPGRGSVRDKLSINQEDALMDEYESAHMAKQQQVRTLPQFFAQYQYFATLL